MTIQVIIRKILRDFQAGLITEQEAVGRILVETWDHYREKP